MKNSSQNTSHAVMAQRYEPQNSLDNFPTPPWATRAVLEKVLSHVDLKKHSCLEPACGAGHMSKVLKEYFYSVSSSDLYDYGYGRVYDFIHDSYPENSFDWVITNPPFKTAEKFVLRALPIAKIGVAVLVRTGFLESVGRYKRLFNSAPPSYVAQFTERVPIVKGRLDIKATTATGYAWCVWEKNVETETRFKWIEPCRKSLEAVKDYEEPISSHY